jgi:hypothetical protein
MDKLLQHTIIGAEFDSSDRHPPPRCHPGTRLAIVKRCKDFIVECNGKEKQRWVVGPAGVGKSAIMQIVAEEIPDGVILGASVFLSVNGRKDGRKIIPTIAFQLAAKCEPYRQFIRNATSRDPSLLRKSPPAQFYKFVVEPFIHLHLFDTPHRYLILIDGLDECDNPATLLELLGLISDLCLTYPTSRIVWIVASRPEPHITSFFEKSEVRPTYTKEEIEIDSDEASEDVQLYLRDELRKVQMASITLKHKRQWPSEPDFTKIATAAGGLFAYASTVVRYINDPRYGEPVSHLGDVLCAIDTGSKLGLSGKDHPMAQLDALYARILSNIPSTAMLDTRKLLLMICWDEYEWVYPELQFRPLCNLLGLTEASAYGAIHHIHSVVKAPEPIDADDEPLEYFHKSFLDYLRDPERSGFFHDFRSEGCNLAAQVSMRVIEEVPFDSDCMADCAVIECKACCILKCRPGACSNISLSWAGDERFRLFDDQIRIEMYKSAISYATVNYGWRSFLNMFFFRALATRLTEPRIFFPFEELQSSVFVSSSRLYVTYNAQTCSKDTFRHELVELGDLKQVPLRTLDYGAVCGWINLEFTSPIKTPTWNPFCKVRFTLYLC